MPPLLFRRLLLACFASGLALACSAPPLAAQIFLNLDFEKASYLSPHEPWGWLNRPFGVRPTTSQVFLDSTVARHGKRSLRIASAGTRDIAYVTFVPTRGIHDQNKPVVVDVWARLDSLSGGSLHIGLGTQDSAGRPLQDTLVLASSDSTWRQHRLAITLPAQSAGFEVVVRLRGRGIARVDNIELSIGGQRVDSTPADPPRPAEQYEWVRRHAVDIGVPGTASARLLSRVDTLFANSRLVGLGEATHGTAQFQSLKYEVIQHAVRNLGVRLIAFEESPMVSARLNAWIQGGPGQLGQLMADIHGIWRTSDVVEMLTWLRTHNATSREPVEFVGIDPVDIRLELDSLMAALTALDPSYAAEITPLLETIRASWESRSIATISSDSAKSWRRDLSSIAERLRANRSQYTARTGTARLDWLDRVLGTVVQGVTYMEMQSVDLGVRDSIMAANMVWQLSLREPSVKAIVWAHNLHIARFTRRMGAFLTAALNTAYVPVGLTTYSGEIWVQRADGGDAYTSVSMPLVPSQTGSIEEMLHRLSKPRLLLDLRSATGAAGFAWMDDIRMTSVGGVANERNTSSRQNLRAYDALLFVEQTTALRHLPCPAGIKCWYPQ